jgi:hypothetical protein
MKYIKIILLSLFVTFGFSSCVYTDDTYVPQPSYSYYNQLINVYGYNQHGNVVDVKFTDTYRSGRDYYFLVVENSMGPYTINGRHWSKASDDYWISPVSVYVNYYYIYPNRSYRCMIMSSWGEYSQEFNMYVY